MTEVIEVEEDGGREVQHGEEQEVSGENIGDVQQGLPDLVDLGFSPHDPADYHHHR